MSNFVLDLFQWIVGPRSFVGPNAELMRHAHKTGWTRMRRSPGRWCYTLSKPTALDTVQGLVTAQPGDMLCVTTAGKQFIDSRTNVRKHYVATKRRKRVENRMFVWYEPKTSEAVAACQITTPFDLYRDIDLIKGRRNDWLVLPANADRRGAVLPVVVPGDIFPLIYS